MQVLCSTQYIFPGYGSGQFVLEFCTSQEFRGLFQIATVDHPEISSSTTLLCCFYCAEIAPGGHYFPHWGTLMCSLLGYVETPVGQTVAPYGHFRSGKWCREEKSKLQLPVHCLLNQITELQITSLKLISEHRKGKCSIYLGPQLASHKISPS